jgi:hypothetical protein
MWRNSWGSSVLAISSSFTIRRPPAWPRLKAISLPSSSCKRAALVGSRVAEILAWSLACLQAGLNRHQT